MSVAFPPTDSNRGGKYRENNKAKYISLRSMEPIQNQTFNNNTENYTPQGHRKFALFFCNIICREGDNSLKNVNKSLKNISGKL